MNELQRQLYLSALGIENYMPRWQLPFAPESIVCELPELVISPSAVSNTPQKNIEIASPAVKFIDVKKDASPVTNTIGDILDAKKLPTTNTSVRSAADILAQLNAAKPASVQPFSLSIWRPIEGVMIIDSRNTKLALPTELFLTNILRGTLREASATYAEEVLHWPMIENSFAKRTAQDARNELQTWLSVQHEIRPVQYLWLMGKNAAAYFLPQDIEISQHLFTVVALQESLLQALILPSLNEILQQPPLKKRLFRASHRYFTQSL